ncbi:fibroin heavy chain-like [Nymphalis io]|uniref:fibroin heavy chain-like n=1 Tax=Inachis io TaxID=171585 RepID=UPI00216A1DED|nr:fibroin heavy chain-like [Nymphalis io]
MNAKIIVVLSTLALSNAAPASYGDELPGLIWRVGRAPNVAFGFGSGFSSNIGGISHSSSIGSSFQSGDASAYGAGIGSSDGNTFARGIGYANASPYSQFRLQQPHYAGYNNAFATPYGSAVSSAQNFGSAVSSSQTQNGFGSAVSSVQNNGLGPYQSAISSAQNLRGLGSAVSSASSNGFGTAVSSAENIGGYGSAISLTQNHDQNNFDSAISAAQNIGGYRSSTAQTIQQQGGSLRHSGATSINGPGIQTAQSHAINNGYY